MEHRMRSSSICQQIVSFGGSRGEFTTARVVYFVISAVGRDPRPLSSSGSSTKTNNATKANPFANQ
jgi:hypothetical protein